MYLSCSSILYNSVLSPSFETVKHPQFWKRRKFPVGWQRWAPRRAKQRGRNKGSRTSVRPAQSNEVLHGDAGAMGDSSCGRDSSCVLFGFQPNFWFWHVLAISYYSMIWHEPEINVAKQLSWSYSILSNNRLQVQWGQGMAQKWSPSKRDGSTLHGPQLTDWLIIFLCPRIRFYFKAKTVQKHLLVGGFNHLEKYDIVNGKDYPIYYGKKTCSKPPTRKLGYLGVPFNLLALLVGMQPLVIARAICGWFSCDMKLVILASAVLPCWKKWNWYWKWQICSMARSDCQSVPKRLGSRFEVLEKSLRHVLLQQNGTSTSEVNFDFLSPGTSADISLSLYRSVMTPYCRCWFILMQTPLHDWYTAKRLTVLYFLCSQHCIYVNIHNIYKSIYNVSCMYIYIYTQYAVYMQYMIDYMHICGPKK